MSAARATIGTVWVEPNGEQHVTEHTVEGATQGAALAKAYAKQTAEVLWFDEMSIVVISQIVTVEALEPCPECGEILTADEAEVHECW